MQIPSPRNMDSLGARVAAVEQLPWVPLSEGKWFKPLRFFKDNRGFVELLKLSPGNGIGLHSHTGEVHAFNLQGSRRLSSGELIGPGDYVYEPSGNRDWWKVEGDEELVVMVVVTGAVNYLNGDGQVTATYTGQMLSEEYRAYCEQIGLPPLDLTD